VEMSLQEGLQLGFAKRLVVVDTRNATRRIARHRPASQKDRPGINRPARPFGHLADCVTH
jgi:hypothetical protein